MRSWKRHFRARIAAVERFNPNEGCGRGGAPSCRARTGGYAFERNPFGAGQIGEAMLHLAGSVPNFHRARKITAGQEIGVRLVDTLDQEMLAVGRNGNAVKDGRLADRFRGAGLRIDQRQLAGAVVVE